MDSSGNGQLEQNLVHLQKTPDRSLMQRKCNNSNIIANLIDMNHSANHGHEIFGG